LHIVGDEVILLTPSVEASEEEEDMEDVFGHLGRFLSFKNLNHKETKFTKI